MSEIVPIQDLVQLQYFLTVAYTGSITKAAELLLVSQPSLSKSISNLEKKLGVELFERSGNKIGLNDYGKMFCKRAEAALLEITNGVYEVREKAGHELDHIAISTSSHEITTLIEEFIIANPKYRISHTVKSLTDLKISLSQGSLDFAIFPCDDPSKFTKESIVMHHLIEDELLLQVPSGHPLIGKKDGVYLSELENESFVIAKSPFEYPSSINNFLYNSELKSRIIFESYNSHIIGKMVANGMGLSFVGLVEWYEIKKSMVNVRADIRLVNKTVKIRDPHCHRQIYLAYHKNHFLSKAAKEMLQYTIEYFEQMKKNVGQLLANGEP